MKIRSLTYSRLKRGLVVLLSAVLLFPVIAPEPVKVYADTANNSVTLSNLDTMKSLYNISANTPNNGISGGEEISNLTGALTLTATDLVFPGRNGLDVSLTRIYNSRDSNLTNPKAVTTNTGSPYLYTNDSTSDKNTHNEKRYNLGAGWSFAFPSVETRDGGQLFLHFTDGSVYRITGTGTARTLEDYPLQDVAFATTTSTIGGLSAAYQLTDTRNTITYFDSTGKWIGTRDAYNNEVTVAYISQPIFGGTSIPVIQSITSSANRVISFSYPDVNTVTVMYPIDGTKTGKLVYNKTAIAGQTNEMQLASVDSFSYIDSTNSANNQKRTTSYGYTSKTAAFDYETADTTKPNGSLTYQLLSKVTYPTGASSNYVYETAAQKKFLGVNGYLEFYRIAERYDSLKGPTGTAQKTQYTKYTYETGKNFSGYGVTGESNPDSLSTGFTVTNSMRTFTDPDTATPSQNRLIESKTYNNKQLLTSSSAEQEGEYKESTSYTYDALRELATAIRQSYYSIDGSEESTYTENLYTYDAYGNVLTYTDPKNYRSTYTYHGTFHSLPVSEETTYGLTTGSPVTQKFIQTVSMAKPEVTKSEQKYKNSATDTTEQTDTTEYTYDTYGNVLTTKLLLEDSKNQLTTYTYDSNSLFPVSVKQEVTKNGTTRTVEEKYEYTPGTGWEKSYLDPNAVKAGTTAVASRKYETEYDLVGRVTAIRSSMITGESAKPERTFSYTYNTTDQTYTTQGIDEEGNKTLSIYDGLGRIREVKAPAANTVMDSTTATHTPVTKQSYLYNGLGEVITVKDALDRATTYDYDNVGRVKSGISPMNIEMGASFNDMLRTVTTTSPITLTSSATTESASDELGRMTSTKQLNSDPTKSDILQRSTAYEVGQDPFRVSSADGNGNQETYQGNGLGLLGDLKQTINGQEQISSYGYNKLRQTTSKSIGGQIQTSYAYDELGQRISKTDTTEGTETYGYDDNGNLTDGTDRLGNPALHTYDERNQLAAWNYGSAGSAVTASFTYYKNGLRKSMTDETGTTQYQYNRDSTLRKVTYPDSKTVLYEYNESGTRKSMTDPFGAITLYQYDNDDRMTKVSLKESSTGAEATQAQYTYTGSVLDTITYGNGLITQYAYEDGFGRLTGMKHLKGSTILNQYSYTYDNNGNITERTSNGQTETFGYDELDRIIASSEANEQYSYDVKGNRTVQLSTASSLHTDTMDYTYDQANQLKSVTRNGVVTTYKYDGDGLMREKNNGSTTRFYYDGENMIAEGSVSGSTISFKARYVRGYQLISMKNQWGTVGYYLENGHGDVVNLYKQDQTLLNTYDYDLWGNPKVTEEADQYSNPFRYAGEYWDTNTGLQNLRARWYDPSIGRFITEDTWEGRINHPDSQNPYIYVVNNPLIYVDPSGHIFDVIFDVASLAYDAYEFVQDPSWANAGYIGLDVAAAAIPFVPSGSAPLRSLNKVDDVSDAVSSVKKAVSSVCNCFVEGTEVLTDQGEKPIKEIEIGDRVLSKDDETGEVAYKEVVGLFQKQADQIYTIHIGEEIIEVTGEHPFWLNGQGWTLVKELKVGDLLVSSEGSKLAITEIEKAPRQTTVYNFEVKDFNSYFVSDLGVWVHNCAVGGTGKINSYDGLPFSYSLEPVKKGGNSIADQMTERGWNDKRIGEAINEPAGTVDWVDQRKGQNNAPVTGNYHKEGGYVSRRNDSGEIIQSSQVDDPNWITYWSQDTINWNK